MYGGIFARDRVYVPEATPRKKRTLRVSAPEVHYFNTSDNLQLQLTRYKGGSKGPVLLIHGIGVSSSIFTLDTIETNLVEYLFAHGYDIWLVDFRASVALPYHHMQFTCDDVATKDIPSAVEKVRRVTGADSIQIIVHCMGAISFFMSMINGLPGVRSAVASQIGVHLKAPLMNKIKTGLYIPSFLKMLGVNELTAYTDAHADWGNRLFNNALRLYPMPMKEKCQSSICHRATFMYGQMYKHVQLNNLTHETLQELFGGSNITTFEQFALMFREGRILRSDGADVYLPHLDRLAIPITFLHGSENDVYLPESTAITFDALCEKNGKEMYRRHVIPNYGHIDCLIGKNAAKDVYPLVLLHLEQFG